jgi:hypothetical protein
MSKMRKKKKWENRKRNFPVVSPGGGNVKSKLGHHSKRSEMLHCAAPMSSEKNWIVRIFL